MDIEVKHNFNAKNLTSFKVSGNIKNAYFPKSIDELLYLLKKLENPVVLGNCSNVLISSYGYNGDVIFTHKCNKITFDKNKVYAQCGAKIQMASKLACEHSLSGFEFMIGFPASIGGAVFMNASAHSQAISDCFLSADIFDLDKKEVLKLTKNEMQFDYRKSVCQNKNYVVLSAEFELVEDEKSKIQERMNNNLEFRKSHQPSLALPNCGSVFKNPINNSAGKLLDESGAKTFFVGGAKVWENHANFIINHNNATSEDILNLMILLYNKVKLTHHIELKPEVMYIGNNSSKEEKIWKILVQK